MLFQPPPAHLNTIAWHLISTGTHNGFPQLAVMQWRPGIQRWIDRDGISVPAEQAGERDWTYVGYHGPDLHRGRPPS